MQSCRPGWPRPAIPITLVPVAAILVASIRLHFLDTVTHVRALRQPAPWRATRPYSKGEEMGWFEHGSTIILFAPRTFSLCEGLRQGAVVRMGEPLLHLP